MAVPAISRLNEHPYALSNEESVYPDMVIKPGNTQWLVCYPPNFIVVPLIPSIMEFIMIERTLFDALVRGVRECRTTLTAALSAIGITRNGWVDNTSAQSILQRSTRTMQSLRSSGRIGYSIIEGKVFYPESEIARMLNQSHVQDE